MSNEYVLAERVSAYLAMIGVCVYAGVARIFHPEKCLCMCEGYMMCGGYM